MQRRSLELTVLAFACLTAASARAEAPESAAPPAPPAAVAPAVLLDRVEHADWLALQRAGDAASTTRQSLSGDAMDRAHQRYLKSFEQPIPARFPRDSAATGGGQ